MERSYNYIMYYVVVVYMVKERMEGIVGFGIIYRIVIFSMFY